MRSCYEDAVKVENSDFCFIQDEFTHNRRQSMVSRGQDFWKAFSDYRQEQGSDKANQILKSIVEHQGLSMALLAPINDNLRGAEVDQIIDAMLLAKHEKTRLLVDQVGSPVELSLVTRARGISSP